MKVSAADTEIQDQSEYVEGSFTEIWEEKGVVAIPLTACKEGEQGFSWSDFINGLGCRIPERECSDRD